MYYNLSLSARHSTYLMALHNPRGFDKNTSLQLYMSLFSTHLLKPSSFSSAFFKSVQLGHLEVLFRHFKTTLYGTESKFIYHPDLRNAVTVYLFSSPENCERSRAQRLKFPFRPLLLVVRNNLNTLF